MFRDSELARIRAQKARVNEKKQQKEEAKLEQENNLIGEDQPEAQQQVQIEEESVSIETTEKLIYELSEIIQTFQLKVAEQQNVSIVIQQYAQEAVVNVDEGNVELKKAHEHQQAANHWFSYVFLTMTVILWIWEFLWTR